MLIILAAILSLFSIYSFALMDPNITFVNLPIWAIFREKIIYLGYYMRPLSALIYLLFIAALFSLHFIFLTNYKNYHPLKISIIVSAILLLSYPFLSHDFFNYLFDERILTYYHQNPYLHKALDYPEDTWLRFMRWTHRNYPYGPTFLLIMFPASMLSFGKFILSFILGKLTFVVLYILSVYFLQKMDTRKALFFATHPFIFIEGLMNAHNDFIAVAFAIIGIYYLGKKNQLVSGLLLLISGGVKYITLPLMMLITKVKYKELIALACIILALTYLSLRMEVQSWYYLNLFAFVTIFFRLISNLYILFIGLLLSYYPYILHGNWTDIENLYLKHIIIIVSVIINIIWLAKLSQYEKKLLQTS